MKLKIDGKRLLPSTHVKYLGIYLDTHLSWQFHINELTTKLCRANEMLAKVRHYVTHQTLIMIYYGIFSSHMSYGCQIWGQNANTHIKKISILQNKALRIIHFAPFDTSAKPLFKTSKISQLI